MDKSLELHKTLKGKIEIKCKAEVNSREDLATYYSPGVAKPCIEIANDSSKVYDYTMKSNTVAIVSDGSAVLGLGNIKAEAALPVMEGKSMLFKEFSDINAIPLCIDTQDTEEIIKFCKQIAPTFGGILLEDISSPKCVTIERRLIEELDIPVFHDDQHGTAIVTCAALINLCRLTKKEKSSLKVFLSGTGAAGSSIARLLNTFGITNIVAYNSKGMVRLDNYKTQNFVVRELVDEKLIKLSESDNLEHAIKGCDVFIGVSVADLLTEDMVKSMNVDPWVFALANPNPEITPEKALKGGAYFVGTGRSDFPNQINNVTAFPGLFKGILKNNTKITEEIKLKVSYAIADCIMIDDLSSTNIIPDTLDKSVAEKIADTF